MVSMVRKNRRLVERFATALAVWILAFSAIIPSLDRELVGSGVWIESEHDEGCAPHHDHTICIQFGKQGWSNGLSIPLQVFPPAPREVGSARHDVPVEFLRLILTHSRAPPHTT